MEKPNKNVNLKRAATIAIAVVGFIGSVLTIYSVFFQEKKSLLEYEIISNTNVLDINANVSKLDILYNGSSLKSTHQNLRIFNVRVKNGGNENILKDFYDENDPIGIKINDGSIIELPEITSASNGYLMKNLKIRMNSSNEISFSNLIIEPNQFYILKILVLYGIKGNPSIESKGKIAGQNKIQILHLETSKEYKSRWKDILAADKDTQINRLLIYGLVMMLLVLISIFTVRRLDRYIQELRRVKLIKRYQNSSGYIFDQHDEILFGIFKKDEFLFSMLSDFLKDPNYIKKIYNLSAESNEDFDANIIKKLILYDALLINGEDIKIKPSIENRLTDFTSYLRTIDTKGILYYI